MWLEITRGISSEKRMAVLAEMKKNPREHRMGSQIKDDNYQKSTNNVEE
jgi:hypothetical protein